MEKIKNNVSDNSKNKKNLLQLKRDNKGAAMVMVLVIIMFISILAAVLMFVSYLGYQMRLMDKRGKDTFYTAETVLDEINTGLQEEASAAMSEAYNDLMKNYAVYDSTVMRSSQFYRIYIDKLKERLQGTEVDGKYDIALIRSWLSDDVLGKDVNPDADGSREKFDTYGAIVESNVTSGSYRMVKKESESLLIEDLKVTFVDRNGYVSIISTDIKLVLPSVSFAQASELPNLEKFSLIADETLAMGNINAGGSVDIKGNAYAGRMTVGKTDENPSFLSGSKAVFESATGTSINDMSLVVSREDVVVNESTFETANAEFWGENIILSASDLDMDGITNLKDDLVLKGKQSKASLSGEYNGFSMISGNTSGTGDPDDDATNPALSSAIVVNGQECSLDLSGLDSMTIAGHSYVQTKTPDTEAPAPNQNKSNVMMAESVAVKSNQLIYLAPAEALGCVIEDDGTIGDTAYGANPLTLQQYEEIVGNPDKYLLLNGSRLITSLGYKPLSNYINQEKVAGQTEKAYMPEVIFKKPMNGGDTLVYCYLKFADEEKANLYFQDYYNINSTQVDQYTRLYAKEIKMPDPAAMLYLNLAGSMLVYDDGQTTPSAVISAPDDGKSNYIIKQRQAETIFNTKTNAFKALSAKLVTNITQLTIAEQGRNAFENIINTTKMDDILDAAAASTYKIEAGASGNVKNVILTKEPDYTVNAATPDSSIIISTGSVRVESSFKGLIIAAGNITAASDGAGITISPLDIKDYSQLLDAEVEIDGTKYFVIDVFRDGINYKSDAASPSGDATRKVALTDLIVYEKWSKR